MKDKRKGQKIYKHIISGKKWHELRDKYIAMHPMCEECEKRGILDSRATEVHHKRPIGTGRDEGEMLRLAYDPNNLEALCHECHLRVHKEMKLKRRMRVSIREMDSDVVAFLRAFGL